MTQVALSIPKEWAVELETLARERGVSVSSIVREAVHELLKRLRDNNMAMEEEVRKAVEEFISQVRGPGLVGGGDFRAFLARRGITSKNARRSFMRLVRRELARRGYGLVVIGGSSLAITRQS
jgi:predicted DNA-binding protein